MKSKSEKAFKKNVETEMHSGKPQKQALAIAYSVQRKNKRKMAKGGMVDEMPEEMLQRGGDESKMKELERSARSRDADDRLAMREESESRRFEDEHLLDEGHSDLHPASVEDDHDSEAPNLMFEEGDSIADKIMKRRRMMSEGGLVDEELPEEIMQRGGAEREMKRLEDAKRSKAGMNFADGGMVDIDENAREDKNLEDDLSFEALKKENYSEESALDDLDPPMDSNEHSDSIDSDEHDMVDMIRRKMKKRL